MVRKAQSRAVRFQNYASLYRQLKDRLKRRSQVKKFNRCLAAKGISYPLLLICLCAGNLIINQARAQLLLSPDSKVSADLRDQMRGARQGARVHVIIQSKKLSDGAFDSLLSFHGGHTRARFNSFNSRAVELPARAVAALAARFDIDFISLDRPNIPFGHVSSTTGADIVRTTSGINVSGLDGTGIAIAVLDSGIDESHKAFLDKSNSM